MRRYRDPVHTSICLMSAAAGRVLHSRSIDKHAIPPTRGQINTRGTPFQANELLMLIWNSNIFWRGAPWSSSTCGRMWKDSGSCAPSSTVLVSGWIEWGHIICMSMGSGRFSSLLMADLKMNKWPMIYFLIMLDLTACPLNPIDYGNIYNGYWNNELNCIIIQRHVGLGITGAAFLLSNKDVEWQCPTFNTLKENGVNHKAGFRSIFQDEFNSPR